jgi:hypothetical protein
MRLTFAGYLVLEMLRWINLTQRLGGTALVSLVVLLVATGTASAAAPSAITGPVTAISPTSATAGGTVNPGGQATTWYLEYGTSTSYGSKTSSTSAGSGTANVAVSRAMTGLTAGTTYHYRLVATNTAATSQGADGIFTTTAAPGAVTGDAIGVTSTSATLNGSVDPNTSATTFYFEYGTSTSYGTKTTAKSAGSGSTPVSVSAPVSGLTRGKLYHYRLVATSDAGTARGADRTFSTQSAPTVVTRAASSITPTTARLNGTVTPNGLATNWYVEYGTTTAYGTKSSARSAGSGTSAVNVSSSRTGLRASTVYHYRLVASNALGTSFGADQAFSTSVAPAVSTGPAQSVGVSTATATGTVDPKGRSTTWWFEYGTTTSYGSKTTTRSAGSGAARTVSEPLSKLSSGTTFHYRLVAKNDVGTTGGADVTFTTVGVTLAPSTLQVVYGRSLRLVGRVPTRQPGEQVTLYAQRIGEPSFRSIATFLTGTDGVWGYTAKPAIGTSYKASWNGGTSPATAIGVRPAVSFRALTKRRFTTRVVASHKFAFRFVQLQRRTVFGRWVTVKRVHLNGKSTSTFRATLPKGRSTLRIAMSVNQAGVGYLAGISRTIVYRR